MKIDNRASTYRDAAGLIESGGAMGYSCWAIEDVLKVPRHGPDTPEKKKHLSVRAYEAWFRPENCGWPHSWGLYWPAEDRHDCRILALCFMAAMVEAGDA